MANINNQPLANPLSLADQIAVWSSGNGDTRRASLTQLAELIEAQFSPADNAVVFLPFIAGVDNIIAGPPATVDITAYALGDTYLFFPVGPNTGPVTIAVDGLAAKTVYYNNAPMVAGQFRAGVPVILSYDNNGRFNAVSPVPQLGVPLFLPTIGGTGDVITAAPAVGIPVTAYNNGDAYYFFPTNANTGAVTLNINALGAKNVFLNGIALIAGQIAVNVPVLIVYNTINGRFDIVLSFSIGTLSTRQVFTATGAGTWNRPAGCRQIRVRQKAAGGGGGGAGAAGTSAAAQGGATTFNGVTATGGFGGSSNGIWGGTAGSGGAGAASYRVAGSYGIYGSTYISTGANAIGVGGNGGGVGGGRGGRGGEAGLAAAANSGAGGGGGGLAAQAFASYATDDTSGGGGEGEYVEQIINNPAASYALTVGAGGNGGGGVNAGGAGGSGYIIVDEYY